MQYYFLQIHKLMAVHICMCYDMGMCVCVRESIVSRCAIMYHYSPTLPVHSTTPPQSQNALGMSFTLR